MRYKCKKCGRKFKYKNHKYCPKCGFELMEDNDLLIQELKHDAIKRVYERSKIKRKELKEIDKFWERTKYHGT